MCSLTALARANIIHSKEEQRFVSVVFHVTDTTWFVANKALLRPPLSAPHNLFTTARASRIRAIAQG
jgi:hypothetical protein